MYNRIIIIVLMVAAFGLIGFYVLEADRSGRVEKEVEARINNTSGEKTKGGTSVINVDQEIERTRHLQPQRKEIIDGMIDGGLASRIENPAGEPFIYVLEPFYLLSLNEQTDLLKVIWYYYATEDRESDVLTIYNDETGQEIGTYTPSGLLIGE